MAAQKKSTLCCGNINNHKTMRLFYSIHRGKDALIIRDLLQEGADINATDFKGRTPLLLACSRRRKEIVDLLIKTGANIYKKCNVYEYTVLHYAARNGWTKIVRSLVNRIHDLELDARDIRGDTAMHHASRSGRLNIVKCLLKKGADIDRINLAGFTPLLCAAQYTKKAVFDLLLDSGANVIGNERLLLYYAARNSWTETVQSFEERVPNMNDGYVMDETALDATSSRGHLELVKCLVEMGTDINGENEMISQEALYHASFMGHLEVVKWLVQKGDVKRVPDLNARHANGRTALHFASLMGYLEIVEYLVEEGTDINIRDSEGKTPLHLASVNGCLEVVKWLVEKGADINAKNCRNNTPLHYAVICNRKDVVDLLIYLGANINDRFYSLNFTLLHIAAWENRLEILQSLVKAGCDLGARSIYGMTALFNACCNNNLEAAQALLQAGASWDIVHTNGYSLFKCITQEFKFVKLFIENGAYFKPVDYDAIVKSSSLKVLKDAKLSSQAIVNKFNNHDLPELYKLPASEGLPCIEQMKIASGSEVAQAIERTAGFEIQTKGHCNILEARPMALSVFSVRSVLEYYEKKTSELKNQLKRQAAFDSENHYQLSSKSMRLI